MKTYGTAYVNTTCSDSIWTIMSKDMVELFLMEIEMGAYDHDDELLFKAPTKRDYVTALRSEWFEVLFEVAEDFDGTHYIDWTLYETSATPAEIFRGRNEFEEWPIENIQSHLIQPEEDEED